MIISLELGSIMTAVKGGGDRNTKPAQNKGHNSALALEVVTLMPSDNLLQKH